MAHPFANVRQSKVEHARVGRMTGGYAAGGAVHSDEAQDRKLVRKMLQEHERTEGEGGPSKARADRPGRARGGRTNKKAKGVNVNVIVAPQAAPEKEPMLPPSGPMAGPPPPPPPMVPKPMLPPPGPMAGGPPPGPMPPMRASGGAVFEEGKRLGTKVQPSAGKNDLSDMNRGKPVTYKTGGAVESNKAPMGPKFGGGALGGTARLQKAHRAERKFAKA